MIYTVTLNPSIDYIVRLDSLVPGITNRTTAEEYYYGGKGINVSCVLAELDLESTAFGFVAGFTGDAIEKGIRNDRIITDFIKLESGISRINIKIKAGVETEINCQGPHISEGELERLFSKIDRISEINTEDDIEKYAKELQKLGAKNVLISLGGDGAMLIDEFGKRHKAGVLKEKVINTVGSGDSMVAGFVAGYEKTKSYPYALKLGSVCGNATAFLDGLATKEKINELLAKFN